MPSAGQRISHSDILIEAFAWRATHLLHDRDVGLYYWLQMDMAFDSQMWTARENALAFLLECKAELFPDLGKSTLYDVMGETGVVSLFTFAISRLKQEEFAAQYGEVLCDRT